MEDIKRGYEYISLANARHKDVESMRDFKRALRGYICRDDPSRRIIKGGSDYYIELLTLGKDDGETETEAEDYFRETEFIPTPHSAYDCTGKPFTRWYKVFKRRGLWMAYHCVGFDV